MIIQVCARALSLPFSASKWSTRGFVVKHADNMSPVLSKQFHSLNESVQFALSSLFGIPSTCRLDKGGHNPTAANDIAQPVPIVDIPIGKVDLRPHGLQQNPHIVERTGRYILLGSGNEIEDHRALIISPSLASQDEDGELPVTGAQPREYGEGSVNLILCTGSLAEQVLGRSGEVHEHG